mgnify:CR=1 FL=1
MRDGVSPSCVVLPAHHAGQVEPALLHAACGLVDGQNPGALAQRVPRHERDELAHRRVAITRARRRRIHPKTLGADKGYHVKDFVKHLREHKIRPHIARIEGRKTPGLDGRTTI